MFAIRCIAFVCFDRSLSSLHIWFVHSLFSFQRSIAHHVLRDCLFILSRLLLSVKPFLKFFQKHYRLADAWISNFYIISRSKSSVNNFFKSIQSRFWRTTSIYYHHFKSMSNRVQKNPSDYRGTKLYHKIVSLVNASASTLLWIHHLKRKTFFSNIRLNTLR